MRPKGTENILKFRIDKVHIVLQWGIMLFIVFVVVKSGTLEEPARTALISLLWRVY